MTIFIRQIAVACSIALAAVAAQAQIQPQTQPGAPAAASGGIASRLIVRGDLQGLQVVDLRSQRRNDMLVVQAEMINAESKDLRLYYRFRWLDAGGMQVGDGEVWKPLVFMGKQSQFLKGTGYGPQATDFRIEMSAEPR